MKSLFIRIFIVVSWITIFAPYAMACEGKIGVNVGECSPDFSIQSIDGKTYSLSQFKGKIVLLNFWATWCKPCIVEMPSMQKAYLQLKKNNIEILAVSIDTNEKEIKEFLDNQLQTHLKFPISSTRVRLFPHNLARFKFLKHSSSTNPVVLRTKSSASVNGTIL
jgi:thiol-disulfide isomerase/thioredoxin